jgi:hypothetical protein
VRARGALAVSQCARKHESTVFYIKLIIFVSKCFNPRFDFLFKIGFQWVDSAVHRTMHGEGGRGRGTVWSELTWGGSVEEEEE